MNQEKQASQSDGLEYAIRLGFTLDQYEGALKRVNSPSNRNQLLDALLDVRAASTNGNNQLTERKCDSNHEQYKRESIRRTISHQPVCRRSSSSAYSSCTPSFPSSSQHSLESLSDQQVESNQISSRNKTRRKIYVDGPNIARTHGRDVTFSWIGIKYCVEWFHSRNHDVKVFVPEDKRHLCTDESILRYLIQLNALIETPKGCNDDMFVLRAACQSNGIVVSNDQFRDEKRIDKDLQRFIESNRLPYIFDDDNFIPASDPLGRYGCSLDEFLQEGSQDSINSRYVHPKCGQFRPHYHQTMKLNQSSNQQVSYLHHRKVQSTRSLPEDQITNRKGGNNDLPVVLEPNQTTNDPHHSTDDMIDKFCRWPVKRTTSSSDAPSARPFAKDMKVPRGQPSRNGNKLALCRTKSHNV